jgi:predicted RNA-binding protein with PUA-like domain
MSTDRCWLVKSEPDVYGIDALERDGQTGWECVRNYQARNTMRDDMQVGDLVLFYHSNAKPPAIVGLAKVCGPPIADPTQFDPNSDYYDATSDPQQPRWMMTQLAFVERFATPLSLETLKASPTLVGMPLLQKGQRLSVQKVPPEHFAHVLKIAKAVTPAR